jgi:hypothetical protein
MSLKYNLKEAPQLIADINTSLNAEEERCPEKLDSMLSRREEKILTVSLLDAQ